MNKIIKKTMTLFYIILFFVAGAGLVFAYEVETPANPVSEMGGPSLWNPLRDGETITVTKEGKIVQVKADLSQIQSQINSVKTAGRVVSDDGITKVYEKDFQNKEIVFTLYSVGPSKVFKVKIDGKVRLGIIKLSGTNKIKEEYGIEVTRFVEPPKPRTLFEDGRTVFDFSGLEIYKNTLYTGFNLEVCSGCRINDYPGYGCFGDTARFVEEGIAKACYLGMVINQKEKGSACTHNFECASNECVAEKCGSISETLQEIQKEQQEQRGLLNKIIGFLKRLFGFGD